MNTSEQFFYDHAGFNFDPNTETEEEGRRRMAKQLAAAELSAEIAGYTFEWHDDPSYTNREWTDEGPEYNTWFCICRHPDGHPEDSISGCDFGPDKHPHNDSYSRVIEAELAHGVITKA